MFTAETCFELEDGPNINAVHWVIPVPYASNDPAYWHFGEYLKVCGT